MLTSPCAEPSYAGETLELLKSGDTTGAAVAHVRYVLSVRDAFELCNGRMEAIRTYHSVLREVRDGR